MNDHSLYEISFNDSIQHLRHALALNENRRAMQPEYLFPEIGDIRHSKRSIIQAWFLGAHIDIGGSAAKDGLALYPLQWMLLESQSKGLGLQFDGSFSGRAYIDNPLNLVLPMHESGGKGKELHEFNAKNGLNIQMGDIRQIHDHQHQKYGARYGIHLNQSHSSWMLRRSRQPFGEGGMLEGYCGFGSFLYYNVITRERTFQLIRQCSSTRNNFTPFDLPHIRSILSHIPRLEEAFFSRAYRKMAA